MGRGLLRIWGSLALSLECLFAAFLASSSTFSFPLTLLWLEIHLTARLHPKLFARRVSCLMRYWPEDALRFFIDEIIAWLSMYNDTFLPTVSGLRFSIHVAKIAPTASASYVLCLEGEPRKYFSSRIGVSRPFEYRIAAAPTPSSIPEPSEKIL